MTRAELRIANRLAELEGVRQWVEHFGAAHRLPRPVLTSLLVSFDEVLSNVISHNDEVAYERRGKRNRLRFSKRVLGAA